MFMQQRHQSEKWLIEVNEHEENYVDVIAMQLGVKHSIA